MVVDGGTTVEPPDGADDDVEAEDQREPEHDEQEREALRLAPERHLRDVESDVPLEERLQHAVGHALPAKRHLGGVRARPLADQHAEHRPGGDRDREEGAGRERLPEFQVRHAAADLDRPDGAVHRHEVADEPCAGDDAPPRARAARAAGPSR